MFRIVGDHYNGFPVSTTFSKNSFIDSNMLLLLEKLTLILNNSNMILALNQNCYCLVFDKEHSYDDVKKNDLYVGMDQIIHTADFRGDTCPHLRRGGLENVAGLETDRQGPAREDAEPLDRPQVLLGLPVRVVQEYALQGLLEQTSHNSALHLLPRPRSNGAANDLGILTRPHRR
ncbi:Uncharacterized protein Fot_13951 [Forsythia ovata]|uniref:Uncharacterized protein n=1 Tax=Forsythia ovata TaxID=205694 RepID=A0ABD1W780_9LAMI